MSALREILAVFDIIVNDAALDAGNKKLDTFVEKLKGVGAAFAAFGIVKSIASFGEHVAHAAREVEFSAGRMEMGTDEYQKLAQVAGNYGMTVDNLQIANTLFTRALANAGGVMGVMGGHSLHAAAAMKSLGLNAAQFKGQRLEQILPTVADAFQKITDPMERVTTGLNLFGHRGRSIMPMMAAGGAELRRQFAAAIPVFEKATIESADKATIAGKALSRTWDNLINNSFGRALLDSFTVTADKLIVVIQAIKELIKHSEIGKATLITLGVALTVAAGIAIAAWWPVLVPLLAIVAAFAAMALAVDDFLVFMEGGDSLLGDFFDKILGPGGAEKAKKFIQDMWGEFKNFLAEVKAAAVPQFLKDFEAKLEAIRNLIHDIKSAWGAIRGFADTVAQKTGLTDQNIMGAGKAAWGALQGGADWVANKTGLTDANISAALGFGGGAPSVPAAAPGWRMDKDGGTGAAAPGITIIGGIDSNELAAKVKSVVDSHHDGKVDKMLRDAFAGSGGAQ